MAGMSLPQGLAELVATTSYAQLGEDAREALANTIIDTLGVMIASADSSFADEIVTFCGGLGYVDRTVPGATIVGRGERISWAEAALCNGTLGHAFDFDDVHLPSLAHFSTIVVPAALAASEYFQCDGERFLEAVVCGDEVGGRLGWAVCASEWGGSSIRDGGFFPTSVLGTIAAAVATAKAGRFDRAETVHAISIAANLAGGLACVSRGDASTKRTQAGWAARAGFTAALMAKSGYTGPAEILETPQGFFQAFSRNRFSDKHLRRSNNQTWICQEMSFKAYPVEYFIQPFVEMAFEARTNVIGRLDEVTEIEACTASRMATIFNPIKAKAEPADAYSALISAPYCIALALTKFPPLELSISDFREGFQSGEKLRRLARMVRFSADEHLDRTFPLQVGGKMLIRAGNELLWSGEIPHTIGTPSRPMSSIAIEEKFLRNTRELGISRSTALLEILHQLCKEPDASWIRALASDVME